MSDPGPPERRGGGRARRAAARVPLRDEVMDAAYAAGWTIVRKMPEPAARLAFAALADRTWHRYGAGVRQLEKNLCRVLGKHEVDDEVRILSKKVLRSYFRYWLEVFRLPEYSRERILGRMRVTGEKKIFSNLEAGRGVILALPHMGTTSTPAHGSCTAGTRSPPSPSGSGPSRCSTGSSPSGKGSAWRCSPTRAPPRTGGWRSASARAGRCASSSTAT